MKYQKVIDNEEATALFEKSSDASDSENFEGKYLNAAITTRTLYFLIFAFTCTAFLAGGWIGRQSLGNLDYMCIRHTSKWCRCTLRCSFYDDADSEQRQSLKKLIINIGGSDSMELSRTRTSSDKIPVLKLMKHGKVWVFIVCMICCPYPRALCIRKRIIDYQLTDQL